MDAAEAITICPKCQQEIALGAWPWCPHERGMFNAQADDIPGGLTLENVAHEPQTFYSHSEKRRYLKEHGLVEFVRHVPVPGSDRSPHTVAWTSVDLEAGKALAERQAHTRYRPSHERSDPATIAIIKDVWEQQSAEAKR